jgi:hypothetical protein
MSGDWPTPEEVQEALTGDGNPHEILARIELAALMDRFPFRPGKATPLHRDLYRDDPPSAKEPRFVERLALDDPRLVKDDGSPTQLAVGWATYYHASEPHTMEDCPHDLA